MTKLLFAFSLLISSTVTISARENMPLGNWCDSNPDFTLPSTCFVLKKDKTCKLYLEHPKSPQDTPETFFKVHTKCTWYRKGNNVHVKGKKKMHLEIVDGKLLAFSGAKEGCKQKEDVLAQAMTIEECLTLNGLHDISDKDFKVIDRYIYKE